MSTLWLYWLFWSYIIHLLILIQVFQIEVWLIARGQVTFLRPRPAISSSTPFSTLYLVLRRPLPCPNHLSLFFHILTLLCQANSSPNVVIPSSVQTGHLNTPPVLHLNSLNPPVIEYTRSVFLESIYSNSYRKSWDVPYSS